MTSFSSVLFIFMVVFIISSSGNKKMVGEAGDCYEWWTCKGEEQCRGKCKDEYKGIGRCDELSPGPGIPRGRNCNYHCKYPPM
ncbi:hypothetical protein F2Q69_00045637 [Brassica cretica]|uniref:Knottin scorpion toxin-like domain-containing protein n=1 Tax=Brassica cretica TaxID=69181 RepID=A0A8S9NKB4_BRACR|nr:hypothetical protein F2Q69_00045637 [Brassica cretica]